MDTKRNTGDRNTGYRNTGSCNTGYRNTGDRNTGDRNTGNCNTGYRNTGSCNTGDRNTGDRNTGYRNTGSCNTGDRNTGSCNTGYRNTGYCNTGNWNTGNWNTSDWNTGYCNTNKPKVRMFNKETEVKREDLIFPQFFYYDINVWINESNMTDKEKSAYPSYVTCGGYLKCTTEKVAWRESWNKASIEDKKSCLSLPNWDNAIFEEISGIDVEKELAMDVEEMTLAQVCEKLGKNIKIIKN